MTSVRVPVPEFLSSRKDIPDSVDPWDVQRLAPMKGGATDVGRQIMRVPFGNDPYSNAVRAHELMHARISPADKESCGLFGLNPLFVEAGEEFRVNTMLRRAGFEVDALKHGTEKDQGVRVAEAEDWTGMVYATGVLAGTAACKDFIRGVTSVHKNRGAALKVLEKALIDAAAKHDNDELADTTPSKTYMGVPRGFTRYARQFAEILTAADGLESNGVDSDGEPVEMDGSEADAATMKKTLKRGGGTFARLILDQNVLLDRRLSGKLGRKKIATDMGRNPRRIDRMLTDPHKRVFDRYTKGQGGIVVIDQSGSMSLNERDVMKIVEAAPGCVIIGYSHIPGTEDQPNVWILADRGKVVSTVREGGSGNGVDGPALRFAQAKRKAGEPFVWVCDGDVTDGKYDQNNQMLSDECAKLVIKYGIHMVYNTDAAVDALKACSAGQKLQPQAVGEIRRTKVWQERSTD
jgi:hypothetical protein